MASRWCPGGSVLAMWHQQDGAPAGARAARVPLWVLVGGVLGVLVAVLAALALFGGSSLPERAGPPVEELAVERTVLAPGTITLTVRNTGPDPVQVAQVFVNDAYVDFTGPDTPIDRLQSASLVLAVPWHTGQPYTVAMLTSTGLVIEHVIDAAVTTPTPSPGFFGLMTLLGTYVGVIPVLQLLGVLIEQVQRHVVGAADVRGLELRRGADVQNGHRVGLVEPAADGARVDAVGMGAAHSEVLHGLLAVGRCAEGQLGRA